MRLRAGESAKRSSPQNPLRARLAALPNRAVPAIAPRRPAYHPAKAVGSFVPRLTKTSFEKFGFSTAGLIADWTTIAGPALAAVTQPERLKWPRGHEAETGQSRTAATLVLRVDPAAILEIGYATAEIAERINAYFGYLAVTAVRLVQAPLPAPAARAAKSTAAPAIEATATDTALQPDEDPLARALARMGAAIAADRARP